MFDAEMSAAGLLAMQCVETHELRELQEISDATRMLERLIQLRAGARDAHVRPEFLAKLWDDVERVLQTVRRPRHATVFPHHSAELAMDRCDGAIALDR